MLELPRRDGHDRHPILMKRSHSLGIVLAVLVSSRLSFGGDAEKAMTPKSECDVLMNAVVPFARQMLSKHHAFFPFGATMSPSGTVARTEMPTGDEQPGELKALVEQGFIDGAQQGLYKATALALDVKTVPPGMKEARNAIEVRLDHRSNYSVRVVFPYSYSPTGELVLDSPFAVPGEKKIFAPSVASGSRRTH
jgi:hypothetical protein